MKTQEVHVRFSTREDLENLEAIKKYCKSERLPITRFIRDCVHFYLQEKML